MSSQKQRQGSTKLLTAQSLHMGKLRVDYGSKLSAFDVGACSHEFEGLGAARIRFGTQVFIDLSNQGIPHHFHGTLTDEDGVTGWLVDEYQVNRLVNGQMVLQPALTGNPQGTVLPLEWLVRYMVANEGMVGRIKRKELTYDQLNLPRHVEPRVGLALGGFVECSTKLEPKDRYVSDDEAMEIAGLTFNELEECKGLVRRAGDVVRLRAKARGLTVWDEKWELGRRFDDGSFVIVDGMTSDELRMTDENGVSLDKDPFRNYLVKVGYKAEVDEARAKGRLHLPSYPPIPPEVSAHVSDLYQRGTDMFCS